MTTDDFTYYQTGGFVGTVPNQGGNGDRFRTMVQEGSVVLNQTAAGYQTGGMVPVMLEQGEQVFAPNDPMAGVALAMNSLIPRFQKGGVVDGDTTSKGRDEGDGTQGKAGQSTLDKLDFSLGAKRAYAPVGRCVTGSLNTMEVNGVPNPAATGLDVGNNPRGGAAQLINSFGWGAAYGSPITLYSPYGNAQSRVLPANQYSKMVDEGKIPSGAVVFQTRHNDWNGTSHNSRGYDMAIAQNNGGYLWNGVDAGKMVYGNTQKVMVLTPGGITRTTTTSDIPASQYPEGVQPGPAAYQAETKVEKSSGSGGVMLKVPYFNQRMNKTDQQGTIGDYQCFSTAAAMMASAILNKIITPDEYNLVRDKFGVSTSWPAQMSALDEIGAGPTSNTQAASFGELKSLLRSGKPPILGLQHNEAGGHMVTAIGYNDKGFIVNDPFGKLVPKKFGGWAESNVSGQKDTKGKAITYPYDFMKDIWTVEGPRSGWMLTPGGTAKAGESDYVPPGTLSSDGQNLASATTKAKSSGVFDPVKMFRDALVGFVELVTTGKTDKNMDADGKQKANQEGTYGTVSGDVKASDYPEGVTPGSAAVDAEGGQASVGDPTSRAVLDSIAVAEGTDKGGYGTMFGGRVDQDLAAGKLTVREVIALGDRNFASAGSGATGRYQFMPQTLEDLIRTGHLTMDTQFTPEAQDQAALDLITRRGINLSDGLSKKEMQGIALEWASVEGAGYTHEGRAQAKYSKDAFLKMVADRGGVIQGMQTGGMATVKGSPSQKAIAQRSQEAFMKSITEANKPIVVPVPMGGRGGSPKLSRVTGSSQSFPTMASEDTSILAMEYKYRITMGASV